MTTTTLDNQHILLPNGITSARPTGVNGGVRYNSTTGYHEYYSSSGGWQFLGAPTVYCCFNGLTGAALTTYGSYSSMSRQRVGEYRLTFNRTFTDANYLWWVTALTPVQRSGNHCGVVTGVSGYYPTMASTYFQFATGPYINTAIGQIADVDTGYVAVWEII